VLAIVYLVIAAGYLANRGFRQSFAQLFRLGWRSHRPSAPHVVYTCPTP